MRDCRCGGQSAFFLAGLQHLPFPGPDFCRRRPWQGRGLVECWCFAVRAGFRCASCMAACVDFIFKGRKAGLKTSARVPTFQETRRLRAGQRIMTMTRRIFSAIALLRCGFADFCKARCRSRSSWIASMSERLFIVLQLEPKYPSYFSRPLVSLLRGLLTKSPQQRLGAGPRDVEAIKVRWCQTTAHLGPGFPLYHLSPQFLPLLILAFRSIPFSRTLIGLPLSAKSSSHH